MKKLDQLIIKTFLGPFILTFFIALFVLVMQFLWKHIEDLVAKGLDFTIVMELLVYASATLVPLAIPIAVLLSSIMTTGAVAENLELVAAKASGIGLTRSIRSVFIFSIAISGVAFFFANNMLPIANFKLRNLLTDISRTRPAIDIQEGAYYEGLKGLTMKVEKKESDQKTFYNMVVYDHTKESNGAGNLIMASKGSINVSDDGNYIFLNLFNGIRYSDMNFYTRKQRGFPFSREFFQEQTIVIDISEFKFKKGNSNYIGNQYTMMTVGQLDEIKKEVQTDIRVSVQNFNNTIGSYYSFYKKPVEPAPGDDKKELIPGMSMPEVPMVAGIPYIVRDSALPPRQIDKVEWGKNFLNTYTPAEKKAITDYASKQIAGMKANTESQAGIIRAKKQNIVRNRVEWHKKFSLSVACILLFFIGAPLGAIIRKGGLGLPLIFSIVIFILYYVISTICEKSVRNMSLPPETGMWISSFVLLPFGLFLTVKASTDSPIFVMDTYTKFFKRIFGRKTVR